MRNKLLALLKVPEAPDPPPGAGDSLVTFRASIKYLYLTAILWLPKQISALLGLLFALIFFGTVDLPFFNIDGGDRLLGFLNDIQLEIGAFSLNPAWIYTFFEALAVGTFFSQMVFSLLMLKLSWELRWYMVGDQSLRIREGLWLLREQTVTIANIQNMTVKQGPLQKLLGIADLEVQTAGGGASGASEIKDGSQPLHVARFRGVEDAHALRNRIQERLMAFKGAGLGDADEPEEALLEDGPPVSMGMAEAAAELRDEARALRGALVPGLLRNSGTA